ncbi:MAG: hypothetical protein QW292_10535 [Candidatus Parvarchaeota archaeon]
MAADVADAYFKKDFIENFFKILKTSERVEPVRHRLEPRVRTYMFICALAYRILAALLFLLDDKKEVVDMRYSCFQKIWTWLKN